MQWPLAMIFLVVALSCATRQPNTTVPNKPDPYVVLEDSRNQSGDRKLYHASECIGAVVNGVCHGSVIDADPARPVCHGTWIGGQCTGPKF
jgi:hypothetical protein